MFISFPKYKLKRNVGLFMLTLIGVNGMVGGGIFVLLGHGAAVAGRWLPLSFLLGGFIAFLGAVLYAELTTAIPKDGADMELVFNTTRKRYYPFIFSWLLLLGDLGHLAMNALGIAFYVGIFLSVDVITFGLGTLLVAGLINLLGARNAGKTEVVAGIFMITLFLIYVILAVNIDGFNFSTGDFFSGISGNILPIIAGTSLIYTIFVGYEYIASVAEEAKEPSKNIPRALFLAVAVSTLIFILISWATLNAIPVSELAASDVPFLLIAEKLGFAGYIIVVPAALIAMAGSLIVLVMVASRRLYELSSQGYFNRFFVKLNRMETPGRSVASVVGMASALLITGSVTFVAYLSNTVYLLGLIVVAISIMSLRRQRPYLPRPFRIPLYPYLPLTMIVLVSVVIAFIDVESLVATTIWALIGYFVYLATRVHYRQLYLATWGAVLFLLLISIAGVIYLL